MFFDAIGAKDVGTIQSAIGLFALIASRDDCRGGTALLRMTLQAHWRRWFTTHLATECCATGSSTRNVAATELTARNSA